ncbi:MAG TPA: hypothetical protein ENK82_04150 [Campylobacterales bacterium]|nr:hypothetical protein [Campylobacterales bacterium]HHS92514.1 hypothetical protein [Campylobacterales bacterium]
MKLIYVILLITSMLNATALMLSKESYTVNETVKMDMIGMSGDKQDWIGIYPVGSSNEWKNVVSWRWTEGKGDRGWEAIALPKISKVGKYEARAFFRNSYKLEAKSKPFEITAYNGGKTELSLERYHRKDCYERLFVSFKNMGANHNDWIGLYPINSNNEWKNVKAWRWIVNMENDRVRLDYPKNIVSGEYEIRAFFHNSYNVEAKSTPLFITPCSTKIELSTSQEQYFLNQPVKVNFKDSSNAEQNWIGIYKAGTQTLYKNNLAWQWTGDKQEGQLVFENLPAGKYDVRAFFNNSYKIENLVSFEVTDETQDSFPKTFLGKGENPAKGVYVFYDKNQDRAFISVYKESLYADDYQGITAVDYRDKENPKITAYQPEIIARNNTLHLFEDDTLLTFLNTPYGLPNLVLLDSNTLEQIDIHGGDMYTPMEYYMSEAQNLFYTKRSTAERPAYAFYFITKQGIQEVSAMRSRGSDYNYLIDQGLVEQGKYYITHRYRNFDRDAKWESHKVIYDISKLPEVKILETIVFDVEP